MGISMDLHHPGKEKLQTLRNPLNKGNMASIILFMLNDFKILLKHLNRHE